MADFEVVTNPDDPIVVVANAVRDKDGQSRPIVVAIERKLKLSFFS